MPRKPPKRSGKSSTPRPQKPRDPLEQLAQRPRQEDVVIMGGRRALQTTMDDEHGHPVHPQIVFWADVESRMVYGSGITALDHSTDGGVSEAITVLVEGLQNPQAGDDDDMGNLLQPDLPSEPLGLPGKIIVADPPLAAKLSARLAPYGVAVENMDDLPEMDDLLSEMLESLGFGPNGEPPPPFEWELPQATATLLFGAAAKVWKRAPWNLALDYPPVAVTLGDDGPAPDVPALYAMTMGEDEGFYGVTFFYAADGYDKLLEQSQATSGDQEERYNEVVEMMRAQGLPVDMIPPPLLQSMIDAAMGEDAGPSFEDVAQDALACLYAERDEMDQTYLAWMDAHGVKAPAKKAVPNFTRTAPGEAPHQPNQREAHALALALEALAQFCAHFKDQLEAGGPLPGGVTLAMTAQVGGKSIPVSFTPADDEVFEEEADDEDEE